MNRILSTKLLFALLFSIGLSAQGQENWTHLRGSKLDGHSISTNAPVSWSETNHILWKTEIRGVAWSSPIVFGDQVWTSSATLNGEELFAVCTDFNSGKILKEVMLFKPDSLQHIHPTNSYATSTPCIEEGYVYMHFGTYGTACVDTRTYEIIWTRTDLNCDHMQGAASSPVIYKNLLILHIEGTDVQYLIALDKHTGKTIWKTNRPREFYDKIEPVYRKAFCTPIVVPVNGKDQLISNGSQLCIAYEPETGKEIWQVFYGDDSTVSMPLSWGGLVFVNSGWMFPKGGAFYCRLLAVDPTGTGDVTKTHVPWETGEDVPQISTPVIVDSLIYMVHERGDLTCLNARDGKVIWKTKLKDQFNASALYASGNIYLFSVKGKSYVIKPGLTFQLIAENQLDGMIKATPAIVRDNVILRTDKFLYRIGN
ncbi:MAG TPA: quinonprotein alcohol dehydrogenase [Prolixibacteraceae bacterium]|jgi:outer membrane protein assembly factor BamB|nr:quinonprotein alcohol dehydrogenase [Prolixibacteraceae bacterium]